MRLTKDQRAKLVKIYYSHHCSPKTTLRVFRNETGIQDAITRKNLLLLVKKFEETSSVADRPRPGRPTTSDDIVMDIFNASQEIAKKTPNGECSLRAIASTTNVPVSTVRKAMRSRLDFYPYRLKEVQELLPRDPDQRFQFAANFLARVEANQRWLDRILWSDEAHFYLSGQVNRWNCRIWTPENPHAIVEKPLHDKKLTVWIGFTAEFLIGPYFFIDDETGQTTTVNGDRYLEMLDNFVIYQLRERNVLDETVFQQDGAPPHFRRDVMEYLQDHFADRLISRGAEHAWPPRSPDLNPCDYFLWGYLKNKVYHDRPGTLLELQRSIERQCREITVDDLQDAVYHILTRMQAIMDHDGHHIEQWL